MNLKEGTLLYHGSYTGVDKIDLDKCSSDKDFGRGFYLTTNPEQAKNFIKTSLHKAKTSGTVPRDRNYGYVSAFRFSAENGEVKIHEFSDSSKEWLWFISLNRRNKLAKELLPLMDPSIFKADIIIGKIANDTTNPVLTTYLNGLYGSITSERAIRFAIEELKPDHLYAQYCFTTRSAIDCLKFQEAKKYVIG